MFQIHAIICDVCCVFYLFTYLDVLLVAGELFECQDVSMFSIRGPHTSTIHGEIRDECGEWHTIEVTPL